MKQPREFSLRCEEACEYFFFFMICCYMRILLYLHAYTPFDLQEFGNGGGGGDDNDGGGKILASL